MKTDSWYTRALVATLALFFLACSTPVDDRTTDSPVVSKTALVSAISAAISLNAAHSVGTATGNVSQSAKDNYTTAIAAAQTVADNASATQNTVNGAVTTLSTATSVFNAAIIAPTNYAALNSAIAAASAHNSAHPVGTSPGEVSQSAKDNYTAAIATAQTVAADTSATQATVNAALSALNASTISFSSAIVAPPATYLYSTAGTVDLVTTKDNWGTPTTQDLAYALDATYNPCIKLTGGGSWGSVIAFTGLTAGKLAEFTKIEFKIKSSELTIKVKVPEDEKVYSIASGVALAGGWTQMSIPMSDFGATAPGPGAATQFAIFGSGTAVISLTDVCLTGVAAVNKAGLSSAVATANTLNAAHAVGSGNGDVLVADKNAYTAAIAAAQAVIDDALATQGQVVAAVSALAAATTAFENSFIQTGPSVAAATPSNLATAAILYTDVATPVGATKAVISSYLAGWSSNIAFTEVQVASDNLLRYVATTTGSGANGSGVTGIELTPFNVSAKANLHLDFYAVGDVDLLKIKFVSAGAGAGFAAMLDNYSVSVKGNWISIDIAKSSIPMAPGAAGTVDWAALEQIVFITYGPASTIDEPTRFYVDNLYFY